MKDDKRPEESLNSGKNSVKQALHDLTSIDPARFEGPKSDVLVQYNVSHTIPEELAKEENSPDTKEKAQIQKSVLPKSDKIKKLTTPLADQGKVTPREETKRVGSAKAANRQEIKNTLDRPHSTLEPKSTPGFPKRPQSKRANRDNKIGYNFDKIKVQGSHIQSRKDETKLEN